MSRHEHQETEPFSQKHFSRPLSCQNVCPMAGTTLHSHACYRPGPQRHVIAAASHPTPAYRQTHRHMAPTAPHPCWPLFFLPSRPSQQLCTGTLTITCSLSWARLRVLPIKHQPQAHRVPGFPSLLFVSLRFPSCHHVVSLRFPSYPFASLRVPSLPFASRCFVSLPPVVYVQGPER